MFVPTYVGCCERPGRPSLRLALIALLPFEFPEFGSLELVYLARPRTPGPGASVAVEQGQGTPKVSEFIH